MNRRTWLGLALSGIGGYSYWRTTRKGKSHSPTFLQYQKALQTAGIFTPCVVIDLDALDHNLQWARRSLQPETTFRVVVKSLPFHGLYQRVAKDMGTDRFMVFHAPQIDEVIQTSPTKPNILLGKPMPVEAAYRFYQNHSPETSIQWLIDTPQRLKEYNELAEQQGVQIPINLEINVGLHRGGFEQNDDWREALLFLRQSSVRCEGLMGYDAHVPKVPQNTETAYLGMTQIYQKMKSDLFAHFPTQKDWTFNGGGSPTLTLHSNPESPIQDLSAGSFALLPSDFDMETLAGFRPSAFISAPVLKTQEGVKIPGIEKLSAGWPIIDPAREQTAFIYGGAWDAQAFSPKGLKTNELYGKSTNQMMYNVSKEVDLHPGDCIFFRPFQSERTLSLFELAVGIRQGRIEEVWSQAR